jgi:hypothetical protein
MAEAPKEETMRHPWSNWLLTCALVVAIAGPALGQSLSPDEAMPGPRNPYSPPPCTGTVFGDVTCSTNFDAWIEQYAADQITGGCGGGNYCPNNPVTRAQMAVFVEKAMRGTGAWSPGDVGINNTALGDSALLHNVHASGNTAIGSYALITQSFDPGFIWVTGNTAVGHLALQFNQPSDTAHGVLNTAVGSLALGDNVTGYYNTGMGAYSLVSMNSGHDNTAIGYWAGARADMITGYAGAPVQLVGNHTGSYNTFLGQTGATAEVDNCTAVGMDAYCDATNQVRLGNWYVNSIGGKVTWSALSDERAKSDIQDLDLGLPFVLALRPVSYKYKSGNGRVDMGFVGQDVEALLGDEYNVLDVGGDSERTLSLRYSELIAPLVKAVQEQQEEIRIRDTRIAGLEDQVRAQKARLDALEQEMQALRQAPISTASGR